MNVNVDKKAMLDQLCSLLKIRSVKSEALPDAPFGEGVKNALVYFLDLAASMGFKTVNYDNYIGEVIFGQGEPFGILCHLDVVPEG
ncbi:MAG: dipeptidase PepV, partial [Clostridia bacterium]|nr:dipeptidase PepV [Clostridia bacterium]